MMLIAHISDFHVFAHAAETSLVRWDAAEAARKVVADIAGFVPQIDGVMFTGDLTDGGSADDYALLRDILFPITVPIFVVPGNHDKRDTLRAAFGDTIPFEPGPFLDYEARLGEIRVLALDTLIEGKIAERLAPAQLEWLAGKLAAPHPELTIILMHHPAFPSTIPALDRMALIDGRAEFGALIAAYRGPLRILSGHIHRPYQALWHNVFCAVAGGPAFQHELDLRADVPEPGAVGEPCAYFLHRIEGSEAVSIHTRYVAL